MSVELRHEADGTPYVRPYLGTDSATGRPIRPYKSFPGMTDEQATAAAEEWLSTVAPASALGAQPTVAGMLAAYIRELRMLGRAPKTAETYESVLRTHIAPRIGRVPYAALRPYEVVSLYTEMHEAGVGRSRVLTAHALLSGAYGSWAERGLIGSNPMEAVPRPRRAQGEARALDEGEYRRLNERLRLVLSAMVDPSPEFAPSEVQGAMAGFMAEHTAMRVGELCGLMRRDVRRMWGDLLVAHTVSEVRGGLLLKDTKGHRHRSVSIDSQLAPVLVEWMAWQARIVPRVAPSTPLLSLDGGLPRPSSVSKRFTRVRRDAGLPEDVHIHTLRHTYISYLIAGGSNMLDIQRIAGHESFGTTVGLYGHLMPSLNGQEQRFGEISERIERGWRFGEDWKPVDEARPQLL